MSLGGSYNLSVNAAVTKASEKCPFTVAAGNESDDAAYYSPASASMSHTGRVCQISAIDSPDVFAWFSNWGNPPVDFAAPGVGILSFRKGGGSNGFAIDDPDDPADPFAHH